MIDSEYKDKVVNNNLRFWCFEGGDSSDSAYLNENDIFSEKCCKAIFWRNVKYNSYMRKRAEVT